MFACGHAARIPLSLINGSRDVLATPLCFHDANQRQTHEQGIVSGSTRGGPLCDGEIASPDGPRSAGVPQCLGVGIPSTVSELLINEGAGRSFIKINLCGRLLSALD